MATTQQELIKQLQTKYIQKITNHDHRQQGSNIYVLFIIDNIIYYLIHGQNFIEGYDL